MLNMTKKTGYGLIAMTHLASLSGGELACARKIAEQFNLPTSLMMNVLKQLSAAGFVESVRGARGGYRLAKRPEDISLADLVEALAATGKLLGPTQKQDGPTTVRIRVPVPLLQDGSGVLGHR